MEQNTIWDDTFSIILIVSVVIGILTTIFANQGSFLKDIFLGTILAVATLISVSSAFMRK